MCCSESSISQGQEHPLQTFSVFGVANQNGIVFSSLGKIPDIQNPLDNIFGSMAVSSNLNANPPIYNNQQFNSIYSFGQTPLTFSPLSFGSSTPNPVKSTQSFQTSSPFVSSMSSNKYGFNRLENHCGISNVTHSRVVGGDVAQLGNLIVFFC